MLKLDRMKIYFNLYSKRSVFGQVYYCALMLEYHMQYLNVIVNFISSSFMKYYPSEHANQGRSNGEQSRQK